MNKEDKNYKKSLEVYIEENEALTAENLASIEYYDKMCKLYTKRIKLAKEQNIISDEQIKQTRVRISKIPA